MTELKKGKILASARDVFLRYGFRRASMSDIGEVAGISRPALYLVFKNKEEIFVGVLLQWIAETVVEINLAMASLATPVAKLEQAFEIWTVRPFEMTMRSPDAKELVECSFDFARDAMRQGYDKFEATIVPVLASLDGMQRGAQSRPETLAHILTSAVRGFKETATSEAELRFMIKELLALIGPVSRQPKSTKTALARKLP